MVELLAAALVFAGVAFFAAGSVGLVRFPSLHARLHALAKADNLGLGLVLAGLAVDDGRIVTAIKLLLVWLLVLAASATTTYQIAHHALSPEEDG